MSEDEMDSQIPQVTLNDSPNERSASQGLSSITKKESKDSSGAGILDLIGSPCSFASLLRQMGGIDSWLEKGDGKVEGSANFQAESAAGIDKVGWALIGNAGRQSFSLAGVKGHIGMDATAQRASTESDMKNSPEMTISGKISDAIMEVKGTPELPGKAHPVKGQENIGASDGADQQGQGSYVQDGEASHIRSVSDRDSRISLKQKAGILGNAEKLSQESAKALDGGAGGGSAPLLEEGSLIKNNTPEGTTGSSSDDVEYQASRRESALLKGFVVRGSSASGVSQDSKAHETQSIKDANLNAADMAKENLTSIRKILTEAETGQYHRNISREVFKAERYLQGAADEIPTGKSSASPLAGQTDFFMVNGVWSDLRAKVNDGIAAPLSFQEVASQVLDGASKMLNNGSSRIVITLEPPNLGTLNMDVRVQHDAVRMLLIADSNEVKQVLHANLDQLKTALQGQGLSIDRFDVLVHERSYNGSQGFQPGGGTLFEEGRGGRDDGTNNRLHPQSLPSGGNDLIEPSVGIISLFA